MRITSLSLEQFRSFGKLTLHFGDGVQIFLGPNGAGKTNIIESIAMLSTGRSCLGMELEHLAKWGTKHFRVHGEVTGNDQEAKALDVFGELEPRRRRVCFVNDVRMPFARFAGMLPLLLFLPQDLDLFTGAPSRRRSFLDDILVQTSPAFAAHKEEYERSHKQRNSLLKQIAAGVLSESQLDVWDQKLAVSGAPIRHMRMQFLQELSAGIMDGVKALGELPDSVTLTYDRKGEAVTLPELQAELLAQLQHYRSRDLILRSTTVGPHRDDWSLLADGRNIATFGSRGQQRSFLLALLFMQTAYLEKIRNELPVILLDDVFSELDAAHQEALLARLDRNQVFISALDLPPRRGNGQVFRVEGGRVLPEPARAVHGKA